MVVGAGPAGLAVGACLRRLGLPFTLLEQGDRLGMAWHHHYDRLHLHTDKGHSGLPFHPFPQHYPRYPSRAQVIEYLEAYARRFQLQPQFGQQVVSVRPEDDGWQVRTQTAVHRAARLVLATGYNREPFIPRWPGQDSFRGIVLHSSQYRNGLPFAGQRVLVVGFGNSGGEIAIDLCESGARPCLAVRGPVNVIPREVFGIPSLAIAILQRRLPPRLADALNAPIVRLTIGDLAAYGLRPQLYGPLAQIQRNARIPLIDVGTLALIKQGQIGVRPGLERFTEDGVVFVDGQAGAFDAVILATGYRPRLDALLESANGLCDERGAPLRSGAEAAPGLYFCGFYVSPAGMLREIALEARRISAHIARQADWGAQQDEIRTIP